MRSILSQYRTRLLAVLQSARLLAGLLLCVLSTVGQLELTTVWADDLAAGEAIYRKHCVSCHGENGQGTSQQPRQLIGDKSVFELTGQIERTMPEGEPELVVGKDAQLVANYIHHTFYSPAAQARLHPPRIETSRLTVRQYRQVIADLIGSLTPGRRLTATSEAGLRGEYFRSRRFRGEDRVIDRVDPVIRFDFGEKAPEPGDFDPAEFAARWQGSVFAPETGWYDIVIRTENAARLWLNETRQPLIDAWVKSGSDTEHRESIWLLGGRSYPLKLEFFKSKQGKETRAAIALEWKPPHGVLETIPARSLSPTSSSETLVVRTAFPPDDRSAGYERGTTVSLAWEQATVEAAIETANAVIRKLPDLIRDRAESDRVKEREQLEAFSQSFVERAFRRPLSPELRDRFITQPFQTTDPPQDALKRVILLTLLSPRFLVVETGNQPDAFARATRLSLGMWDSLPDSELLQAAADGRLETADDVAREARRMLADPRTTAKLHAFLQQWLRVDQVEDLTKDPNRFAPFTPELAADLRSSLQLFLDDFLRQPQADYRQLLLTNEWFINARLAAIYGGDLPGPTESSQTQVNSVERGMADFYKTRFEERERAGVLTHPFLLSAFAYSAESSPIHRGVFVARSLLGRALRPPPEAINPLPADLHPDLTTRERVALQTRGESCAACHALINPLGFPLEGFDAIGKRRIAERGKTIDESGSYVTRGGEQVSFSGPREFAEYLARSPEAHQAFVEQLFDYVVKQPARAFGADTPEQLVSRFTAQEFNIHQLLVDILIVAAQTQPAGVTPPSTKLE